MKSKQKHKKKEMFWFRGFSSNVSNRILVSILFSFETESAKTKPDWIYYLKTHVSFLIQRHFQNEQTKNLYDGAQELERRYVREPVL